MMIMKFGEMSRKRFFLVTKVTNGGTPRTVYNIFVNIHLHVRCSAIHYFP